jgi:hypothetical protein
VARTRGRWLVLMVVFWAVVAVTAVTVAEDATRESIRVHGLWKIEVFDPDGTPVSVTTFENALVNPDIIAQLMTGQWSYGGWHVSLSGGTPPCLDPDQESNSTCFIGAEGVYYGGLQLHSTNLTVRTAVPGGHILLQGSVTAGTAGAVEGVSSHFSYCSPDVPPATCPGTEHDLGGPLTVATIEPPPAVVAGQLIQVTVDISFSS